MKIRTVHTIAEVNELLAGLATSAQATRDSLRRLLEAESDGLRVLSQLKFLEVACDPLDRERPLNLIEQLNQTFTYRASLEAAAWLLEHHAQHAPFQLRLGTSSGTDIESHDGAVLAEVFAAVTPNNNRKLEADLDRLRDRAAPHRYVFYLSPTSAGRPDVFESDGVRVRRLQP